MNDDPLESSATNPDDFFFEGADITKEDIGGNDDFVDREGWYHAECSAVTFDLKTVRDGGEQNTPSIKFIFTILETVAKQSPAGSKLMHQIYIGSKGGGPAKDGSRNSAFRFGIGMGILEEVEGVGICIAGTKDTKIKASTWEKAVGVQRCFKVVKKPADPAAGQNRDKYEIDFGRVYHPGEDKVADVPKNVAALAAGGYKNVNPGTKAKPPAGGTAAAGSARNEPPKQQPPAGASKPPVQNNPAPNQGLDDV